MPYLFLCRAGVDVRNDDKSLYIDLFIEYDKNAKR